MANWLFTSESVSEGHPDKVCDQISDAVLDALLAQDPASRVACETLCTTGLVVISGEVTTQAFADFQQIARKTIHRIGYASDEIGFNAEGCGILCTIHAQSPDIAMGVNEGEGAHGEQGAGDQGMMFGYACDETPEQMPLPIMLAHRLVRRQSEVRRSGAIEYLLPDAKSQVTIEYNENHQPLRVHTVVLSTQHRADASQDQIRQDVIEQIINPVISGEFLDDRTIIHVNPTGRFVVGGPHGDTGLTGRKIIVDTYGGMGRHGGGAFSGKDPSKVDRSASYAARWIAKNIVAGGAARRCEVQISYAIGVAEPVSVNVRTFGTGKVGDAQLERAVADTFQLSPAAIIEALDLRKPIYEATAAYGHFGREGEGFKWEETPHADTFKNL